MLKRLPLSFEFVLILFVILSHAYAALSPANSLINWYTTDDAYYYFKVAQNISEGYGITFDRIGRTNGFHPLWMLICVPIFSLARYDLILPLRLVVLVLALLNAGSAVLLYRLLKIRLSSWVAALGAIFWAFSPRIHGVTTTLGMESGINAFLTILLLYKVSQLQEKRVLFLEKPGALFGVGVLGALVLFSRLDNIFLLTILGLWLVLRNREERFLVLGDVVLIVTSVFLAYVTRLGIDLYYFYADSAVFMMFAALVIKPIVYTIFGLYRRDLLKLDWKQLGRVLLAVTVSEILLGGVMMMGMWVGAFPRMTRLPLLLDWPISLLLVMGWRALGRLTMQSSDMVQNTPLQNPFSIIAWKRWLPGVIAYFAPWMAMLLLYMGWSEWYFGTASPVSGQVKRWWGTLYTVYGKPAKTLTDILGITQDPDLSPWSLLAEIPYRLGEAFRWSGSTYDTGVVILGVALVAFFIGLLWFNRTTFLRAFDTFSLAPLYVGCFLQIAHYKMSGYVSLHTWYWVAEMLGMVILLAIMVENAFGLMQHLRLPWLVRRGVIVLLAGLILMQFGVYLHTLTPWEIAPENREAYLAGARGLEQYTEPGALIGSTGGGSLAYFTHDRTIVNMDGLISSYPYFQMLKSGQGAKYFDSIGLDYVYGGEYVLRSSEPYVEVFKGRLKPIELVAGSTLFRYLRGK